jgi:hypothetical protein
MAETIANFQNQCIAFYRPRKRSYFLLQWQQTVRKWMKYMGDQRTFTLHRATTQRNGSCHIVYATSRGRSDNRIYITADGHFLKSGDMIVPILETGHKFGQAMYGTEMLVNHTLPEGESYEVNQTLWAVAPPPAPEPAPAPIEQTIGRPLQVAPRAPIIVKRKEPIPRRIAWLIAEDAQKQGETCAITMEDISPLTAAVTTCFHVFDAESLQEWFERHRTSVHIPCPVCRKNCSMTRAFDPLTS